MSQPVPDRQPPSNQAADLEQADRPVLMHVLLILAIALTARVVYLLEIKDLPFFYWPIIDAKGYDDWAKRIAAGDWLGADVFYQAPLYPYFLAVVYRLVENDLLWARLAQAVLGSAACVFTYLAGTGYFSRRAGFVAGMILALYAPAIFFDGLIQKASLGLLLMTLLLWVLSTLGTGGKWSRWIGAGVMLGLLALTRENTLLLTAAVALWALIHFAGRATVRGKYVALLLAGVAVVLLPVGFRNLLVGGQFALTTSQVGPNFYIGNNPDATGVYAPLRLGRGSPDFERGDATHLAEEALGRTGLTPREVSHFWLAKSWEFIRTEPAKWLALLGKKCLLVINAYEVPDAEDFYLYRRWSWLLTVLGVPMRFGVLLPLAVGGLIATWHARRQTWLLHLMALTIAAGVAGFFVFARYRFPLVPFLALFAAAGVVEAWAWVRQHNAKRLAPIIVVVLIVAAVAHLPLSKSHESGAYVNLGLSYAAQGNHQEAIRQYERAMELRPTFVEARFNKALSLSALERYGEAADLYREVLGLLPTYTEARVNLGSIYARQGRPDLAVREHRQAIADSPDYWPAWFGLGKARSDMNDLPGAIEAYNRVLQIQPDHAVTLNRLGRVYIRAGRFEQAVELYQHALRIEPDNIEAINNLGNAFAEMNHIQDAIAQYRRVIDLQPGTVRARMNLGNMLQRQNEWQEAISVLAEGVAQTPDDPLPAATLAKALATCPIDELRDISKALDLAERACRSTGFADAYTLDVLIQVYEAAGRDQEAAQTRRKLQQLRPL